MTNWDRRPDPFAIAGNDMNTSRPKIWLPLGLLAVALLIWAGFFALGAYLVIYASSSASVPSPKTGFGLKDTGDTLTLSKSAAAGGAWYTTGGGGGGAR